MSEHQFAEDALLAHIRTTVAGAEHVLVGPGDDLVDGHGAGLPGDDLAVAEQEQGGNARHAEFGADGALLVRIELQQAHGRLQRGGGGGELRAHGPAGTAPRGPDVDQHGRALGRPAMGPERLAVHLHVRDGVAGSLGASVQTGRPELRTKRRSL